MSLVNRMLWVLVLGLAAATILVNGLVSRHNAEEIADAAQKSAHSRDVIAALDDVAATIIDAESGQRGYLLTQRPAYLDPYRAAVRDAGVKLARLRDLVGDDAAQRARLAELEPLIAKKFDELRHTLELNDAGRHDEALQLVVTDAGMLLMREIREHAQGMRVAELERQRERDASVQATYKSNRWARDVGMLVGLALVLLAIMLLRRDLAARARASEQLFREREWFSTTLNSIGDAVIVTDRDGVVQLMNPVAERLTGWRSTEAAGRTIGEVFDIINETTRETAIDPVRRAIAEGHIVGLANHTVLRSRDGNEYVIEDSAAPSFDTDGKIQGAVMVFHDATERRKAEIALSMASAEIARRAHDAMVAERTLDTILVNAPIGICMTGPGPDYPIVVISRQMKEWIGAAENMPAHAAYRKLLPDGREPPPDLLPINRVMLHGQSVRDEPWLIERKGHEPLIVIVDVEPVRDEEGTIVGAIHSWVDLTERQRLDHELRVTQSRLRVLVEANVIGLVLSFDRRGEVAQANYAFLDMLGFTAGDIAAGALNLVAQTPAEFRETDARAFAELEAEGVCAPYEKELLHKDGRTRIPVLVGYAKVADADDEFVGFALDISERKELERRLRERTDALLVADRRKDEFLAMLAHELRNPLAPLRNAVYLLDTAQRNDASVVAELVPSMRRQIDHLVRLVDDLLDAARISQGKISIEHAVVELAPSLHAAIESVEPLIRTRRHALALDLAPEPLYVEGDATRLTQMFANVIHNAAKYTPPNGRIQVTLAREGDVAAVRVRDNGQGISAELLPRIFEPFIQDDQSLAHSAGGLGVGLALVRKLCELHGGTVSAASAGPGRGSEFELRLPLVSAEQAPRAPAPAPVEHAPRARRVLVVDDNADLATSTATLLELWGHTVKIVYNGRDVLDAALAFAPHAVLLDIGLPGMDGFEVARRIREHPDLAAVRLIAITGYGQQHDRERALAVGFDAHLVKPVQPDTLKALLDGLPEAV